MAEERHGGLTCAEATDLASGFVLDALQPDEATAVRAHLAACPRAHPAFDELGSVVPALLESVPIVEPPAHLRSRIMAVAAQERAVETGASLMPGVMHARPTTPVRIDRRPAARWSMVLRIAAVLAIVALGVSNLSLQQGLRDADRYAAAVTAALDLAARPGSVTAVLAPSTPGGPTGLAAVGADGTLAIAVRGLAATAGREVYEAWVIEGGRSPVPIGAFTVGSDGRGGLAIAARAAAPGSVIALTREPGPGATAPTLPIVASGAALARPG